MGMYYGQNGILPQKILFIFLFNLVYSYPFIFTFHLTFLLPFSYIFPSFSLPISDPNDKRPIFFPDVADGVFSHMHYIVLSNMETFRMFKPRVERLNA
jgi:hypothetical protein